MARLTAIEDAEIRVTTLYNETQDKIRSIDFGQIRAVEQGQKDVVATYDDIRRTAVARLNALSEVKAIIVSAKRRAP
jgi:hypothetical protein